MKKSVLTLSVLAMSATAVFAGAHLAGEKEIAARQAIMWANNDAGAVAGSILKGDLDFNPLVARAALKTMRAGAHTMEYFFPEGSVGDKTNASPKIWEDPDGFEAAVTKFKETADAAVMAAGRDGPADLEAFKAVVLPVFGSCNDCHETYRLRKQ